MKDKIDAVILFVDMNDKKWRDDYNKFVEIHEIPNKHINNETRFRDYGSLRGILRSMDTYASWINNVFLVVQRESQVPKWINRNTVKVVLHEEFIPKEFLPTYNCNTLETHLHFIPGLSEKFIYFNDDMFLNSDNHPCDYFINEKCVHYMFEKDTNNITPQKIEKFYRLLRFSNVKTLHKILSNEINLEKTYYNSHGPTPMLKSLCEEIYNKINIKEHITPFREVHNLTQELFTVYALMKRKLICLKHGSTTNRSNNSSFENYTPQKHEKFKTIFLNGMSKTYCINDCFQNESFDDSDYIVNEVEKIISIKLPNKSKYEI